MEHRRAAAALSPQCGPPDVLRKHMQPWEGAEIALHLMSTKLQIIASMGAVRSMASDIPHVTCVNLCSALRS